MKRQQNKNFIITVEGECEKLYFEHLRDLINASPNKKYICTFKPEIAVKKMPYSCSKQAASKNCKFYHIQDIEDANDPFQRQKFKELLDDIHQAQKIVDYKLGYTNYTFELWVILHKNLCDFPISHRKKYIDYINRYYGYSYEYVDEYKKEENFKALLEQISLADVQKAIENAKYIRGKNNSQQSKALNQKKINYKKYSFFRENPDLDIHEVVEEILRECF